MASRIYFFYLAIFYGMIHFSNMDFEEDKVRKSYIWGTNYNETHFAAVLMGLGIGLVLRRRVH